MVSTPPISSPKEEVKKRRSQVKDRHELLVSEALEIVKSSPQNQWMLLLRSAAGELGIEFDLRDNELQDVLDAAERQVTPVKVYRGGDRLEATESVFLLDGMVKLGEANVIIGQPKVGKSSFSTGLIAALRDRKEKFLGRDLMLPGERMPVMIFGTDQSEGDWLHFLRREGLVDDTQQLDSGSVDFFCSMEAGQQYNFTSQGLKAMKQEVEKYQLPLVIIDSLSSMMEPTGIEENTSRYAQPIRQAIATLRKTGATLLIIHHSVKRPTTWDWIAECRGSSSISSVFSWGMLMRWVAQEEDGLMRTDRRVGFAGKGRGSADMGGIMGLYEKEGGWTYIDGLEQAQQVERVKQRISELGGVRASVFDYLTVRAELGADVSPEELATELNKQRSNVNRELGNLKAKGLAYVARQEETGSRPRSYWSLPQAVMEALSLRDTRDGFFDNSDSFANKTNKIIFINSQDSTDELQPNPIKSSPRTPVEVNRNGAWSTGWLIHDARNPDSVIVEKLGSPNIRISSLRWDLDVRAIPASPIPDDLSPEALGF